MSRSRIAIAFVVCVSVALFSATADAAASIDSTLYTSYFFGSGYQNLTLIVCGSTTQTSGCYGSAGLGPFGKVGAMIEGNPSQNLKTSTVTRRIYIVDVASGTAGTGVTLYVYKKTDTVTASSDTITVTLTNTVDLPLTGGTNAVCSLAGNNGYLFIGTDQSPQAVRVAKSNLSTQSVGGFSPPVNVTSITSDKYGYVPSHLAGLPAERTDSIPLAPMAKGWEMVAEPGSCSAATLASPPAHCRPSRRARIFRKGWSFARR